MQSEMGMPEFPEKIEEKENKEADRKKCARKNALCKVRRTTRRLLSMGHIIHRGHEESADESTLRSSVVAFF